MGTYKLINTVMYVGYTKRVMTLLGTGMGAFSHDKK